MRSRRFVASFVSLVVLGICFGGCGSSDVREEPTSESFTFDLSDEPSDTTNGEPSAEPAPPYRLVSKEGAEGDLMQNVNESLSESAPTPGASEVVESSFAFPGGAEDTGVVQLDRRYPSKVLVGEPFEYELTVTNLLDRPLDDVRVHERLPDHFRIDSAQPEVANIEEAVATWRLGHLGPRHMTTLRVIAVADKVARSESCSWVTYDLRSYTTVQVVQPVLKLTKWMPEESLLCDTIPVRYILTNAGTGLARDVKIEEELPENLRLKDDPERGTIRFRIAELPPGESGEFAVTLRASSAGTYATQTKVTAYGGIREEPEPVRIVVREPVLSLESDGPTRIHLGRKFTHRFTLSNQGDAPAENTVLHCALLPGAELIEVDPAGSVDDDSVTWHLGAIGPSGSRELTLAYRGLKPGSTNSLARASAICAVTVEDRLTTELWTTSMLELDVDDRNDPTVVGDREVYAIRVRNNGTAPDTNVQLTCSLDEGMEFVTTSGTTDVVLDEKQLRFAPLVRLAPGDEVSWEVTVKAVKEGDMRFRVELKSDQLERAVDATVATRFYK